MQGELLTHLMKKKMVMKSEFGARPIDFEPTPHYRAFSASLGWNVPHFRGPAANPTAPVATTQLDFGGGGTRAPRFSVTYVAAAIYC